MKRKPIIALIHWLQGSLHHSYPHTSGVFEHLCWGQLCEHLSWGQPGCMAQPLCPTSRATRATLAHDLQMTPMETGPKDPASYFLIFLFLHYARHPGRLGSARGSIFQGNCQETSKMAPKLPPNHLRLHFQKRPKANGSKQQRNE